MEIISKNLQRVWEDRLWENSLVLVAGKKVQAESIQQNLQNKPAGHDGIFVRAFLNNHVKQISIPTFVAVSGSLGWKVPIVDNVVSAHEQEKIILPHSLETAKSLNFERIGTITLIWNKRNLLRN